MPSRGSQIPSHSVAPNMLLEYLCYSRALLFVLQEQLDELCTLCLGVLSGYGDGGLQGGTEHAQLDLHQTTSKLTSSLALAWSHTAPNSRRILAVSFLHGEKVEFHTDEQWECARVCVTIPEESYGFMEGATACRMGTDQDTGLAHDGITRNSVKAVWVHPSIQQCLNNLCSA